MLKMISFILQEPPSSPERPHQLSGAGCVRAAAWRGRTPSQCGLQSAGHPGEAAPAPAPGQVTAGGVHRGPGGAASPPPCCGPGARPWCPWTRACATSCPGSGHCKVSSTSPSSSHVTHRDLSSVTHAGRTLASLAFYVSGAASTAEDGLTSLYDTVSVCSVSPSSSAALKLCHPDLQRCHLTHWSTLSPDPKSEFPPQ